MRLTARPALAATAAVLAVASLGACSSDDASTKASGAASAASTAASKAGEAASSAASKAGDAASTAATNATSAVASASAAASSAASAASTNATSAAADAKTYTLAQVGEHKTPADCWAAIKAPGQDTTGVYDLTQWIGNHPGGKEPIQGLCGTNATEKFLGQHGDDGAQGRPEQMLSTFKVGTLAG